MGDVSRILISQIADDEIVSWRGRSVRACELFFLADIQGHQSVPFLNTCHNPLLEIPN